MMRLYFRVIFISTLLFIPSGATLLAKKIDTLPCLQIMEQGISISGVSAGAYAASQINISNSKIFGGVGVISGGFFACAEGDPSNARNICMPGVNLNMRYENSIRLANELSNSNKIDQLSNLKKSKVAIIASKKDNVVSYLSANFVKKFYSKYCDSNNIHVHILSDMPHGVSSLDSNSSCNEMKSPYIYNCGFDSAQFILESIYGKLKKSQFDYNNLYEFDQSVYSDDSSVDSIGYIYIPKNCISNKCRIHFVLHGCLQGAEFVGDKFVVQSGYLKFSELNNIVFVFPQNKASEKNPNGCWDWWGYTGKEFYTKDAPQNKFIMKLLNSLNRRLN